MPLESKTVQNFQGVFTPYQKLAQPKGAVSLDSNLWFAIRGALSTFPGSKVLSSPGEDAPSVIWRAIQYFFPSFASTYKLYALSVQGSSANLYDVTMATWNGPAALSVDAGSGSMSKRPAILGGNPQPTPSLIPFADALIVALSDSVPPYIIDDSTAPAAPTLSSKASGSLGAATYYARVVYTGYASPSGESSLAVAANYVLVVDSPAAPPAPLNATTYDVYVGTASGQETKQNTTPVNIGSNWTMPDSGPTDTGAVLSPLTDSPGGHQLLNNFNSDAKYGTWKANHNEKEGKIIAITINNIPFEYSCTQSGKTGDGSGSPGNPMPTSFPTQVNATIVDGDTGWQCLGPLPGPPPGAAFAFNHLGFLWLWGVSSTYLADGISGPDAIWQSGLNDAQMFDPAFTGFVGKGNGETAQGGAVLTLNETGIAATQQLVLFKDASTYSVFGDFSTSIQILQAPGGVGCIAPGSVQFIADLGILRLSYKGMTLFDGQNDITEIYTDPIRGYIFGLNDPTTGEQLIAPLDFENIQLAKSTQCKEPSCYVMIAPVKVPDSASSPLELTTRVFVYDLAEQIWAIGDFPCGIGAAAFLPTLSGMESVVGGVVGDTIRRVMNPADLDWGANGPLTITGMVRAPEFGRSTQPLYIRRVNFRAEGSGQITSVTARYKRVDGRYVVKQCIPPKQLTGPVDIQDKVLSVHLDIGFSGQVVIEGIEYQIAEKAPTRIGR
jgi:hypothetical protein